VEYANIGQSVEVAEPELMLISEIIKHLILVVLTIKRSFLNLKKKLSLPPIQGKENLI